MYLSDFITYVQMFYTGFGSLCFYGNDNTASFNENLDGATNPAYFRMFGGVCKLPGNLYYTKI